MATTTVTPLPESEAEFLRVLRDDALTAEAQRDGAARGLTQADLELRTGLSRPSVVNLVKHLRPVLRELAADGTRATRLALDPSAGIVLGVYLGHGHAAVVDADLWGRASQDGVAQHHPDVIGAADGTLDWVVAMIQRRLSELGRTVDEVAGVGIAMAGPIDRPRGVLRPALVPGDLEGGWETEWQLLSPQEHLRRRLGWEHVPFLLDNDANAAALAEHLWGAARASVSGAPYEHVLRVEWSRGIGSGLILDGRLFRGAGVAGELGHTVLEPDGPVCPRCGNRGCFEVLAGTDALVSAVGGVADVAEAAERARSGDAVAIAAFRQVADRAARALGPLVSTLNPNLVVIGGTIGHEGYDVVRPTLLQAIRDYTMRPALRDVEIARTTLPRAAALRGALALVLRTPREDGDALLGYLHHRAAAARVGRGRTGARSRQTAGPAA